MPLALFDVDDAEGFVRAIVNRSGLELDYHDAEDCAQFLLIQCWKLSINFEPWKGSVGFSTFAGHILRRRTYDWVR